MSKVSISYYTVTEQRHKHQSHSQVSKVSISYYTVTEQRHKHQVIVKCLKCLSHIKSFKKKKILDQEIYVC